MNINKSVMMAHDVLEDVICDCCKKSCKVVEHVFNFGTLRAEWGYGSNRDGSDVEYQLCEVCFEKIENTIKQMSSSM